MRFHFKIMPPEITAPLFVSPRDIPLSLRLAAKVHSGRMDLPQRRLSVRGQETRAQREHSGSPAQPVFPENKLILAQRMQGAATREIRAVKKPRKGKTKR